MIRSRALSLFGAAALLVCGGKALAHAEDCPHHDSDHSAATSGTGSGQSATEAERIDPASLDHGRFIAESEDHVKAIRTKISDLRARHEKLDAQSPSAVRMAGQIRRAQNDLAVARADLRALKLSLNTTYRLRQPRIEQKLEEIDKSISEAKAE